MSHPIPSEVFEQHVVALGKTGAGKSYALRGLVERLLADGKRVCIVDPKGDWWGLKSSASGKSSGFPVVIFGGEHADVPLNPHCGGQVAELVATGNRPCILDFGGWTVGDRTRFWIDFAAGLFKHNRGPLWLVMDEVHNFAPQGKILDPDAGKCLHWTNRLASEGRGKGIRILMASQRPQKVHKDTLTCAETLIAMRVIHPLDRGAVKEWMDGAGDPAKAQQVLSDIASLQRGQGFVWSPEIKFFGQVEFPRITTFDSFATPTDDGKVTPKGWAHVDLDEVKERLCQVVEQAKANDPAELKRQNAALWKNPAKWNREAGLAAAEAKAEMFTHERPRVFPSLCDWLDDEVPIEWLADFLKVIHDTPNLDWLLLTKRPENFFRRVTEAQTRRGGIIDKAKGDAENAKFAAWIEFWRTGAELPANVWIGTSVEDRPLRKILAVVRFLSLEPLLENLGELDLTGIDWVIVGGESGSDARPCNIEWFRSIIRQCKAAGVYCFGKQLGANIITDNANMDDWPDGTELMVQGEGFAASRAKLKHPKGGDWSEWPEDLKVREFPVLT